MPMHHILTNHIVDKEFHCEQMRHQVQKKFHYYGLNLSKNVYYLCMLKCKFYGNVKRCHENMVAICFKPTNPQFITGLKDINKCDIYSLNQGEFFCTDKCFNPITLKSFLKRWHLSKSYIDKRTCHEVRHDVQRRWPQGSIRMSL